MFRFLFRNVVSGDSRNVRTQSSEGRHPCSTRKILSTGHYFAPCWPAPTWAPVLAGPGLKYTLQIQEYHTGRKERLSPLAAKGTRYTNTGNIIQDQRENLTPKCIAATGAPVIEGPGPHYTTQEISYRTKEKTLHLRIYQQRWHQL